MYTGRPRSHRFGGQIPVAPGANPPEGVQGGGTTPFNRREAVLNRIRERRTGFAQAGSQSGSVTAPGGLRARLLERLNNLQNPSAPQQDQGPV